MVGLREEKFGKRRRNERTTNTTTFLLKLWWALSFSIFHSLFQFPTTKHSHSSCNYYPLTIGTSPKDQYYDATNACLPPFAFLFMVAQIYIYVCVSFLRKYHTFSLLKTNVFIYFSFIILLSSQVLQLCNFGCGSNCTI